MLYWPLVTLLTVGGLTSLYHISTPRRSPWLRDAPGAVVTMVLWIVASFVVRGTIAASLAAARRSTARCRAPIVLLIWLYTLAIAVLIGAAANASIRELYPHEEQRSPARAVRRLARRSCGSAAPSGDERPAGWDDPFDGYGPGDAGDDLGLSGLREAARGPLTPMSGAGRSTPSTPAPARCTRWMPGAGSTPSAESDRSRRPAAVAGLEIVTAIG